MKEEKEVPEWENRFHREHCPCNKCDRNNIKIWKSFCDGCKEFDKYSDLTKFIAEERRNAVEEYHRDLTGLYGQFKDGHFKEKRFNQLLEFIYKKHGLINKLEKVREGK